MQTCTIKSSVAPVRAARATKATRVVCMANMESVKKAAAGFGVGVASLVLTGSAFAGASVKLGADSGTYRKRSLSSSSPRTSGGCGVAQSTISGRI